MQSKSHAVPKPLWDNLSALFQKKARELIKDIAETCNQDEKILWDAYKANKHTVHFLEVKDPTDGVFECEALCASSSIHTRCRKPVLFGSKFCGEHEFTHLSEDERKPALRRCISEENELYFLNSETNEIFNHEYKKIGLFINNRIVMFEILNETEYE